MTVYLSYSANITPDTQQYKTKIYLLYQTDPLWRALENFLVLQFQLIPDCPRRCTAHPYNSLQLILLPALYLILLWSINEATYSCIFLPSSKPPGQQRDGINNSQYATMKSKATALTYHLWCSTGPAMQLVSARSWKPLWFEWSQKNLKNLKINCPKKNPTECPYIYCYDNNKLKDLYKTSNGGSPSVGINTCLPQTPAILECFALKLRFKL